MDGENNGSKPCEQMGDLGVPPFLETPKWEKIDVFLWMLLECSQIESFFRNCFCVMEILDLNLFD